MTKSVKDILEGAVVPGSNSRSNKRKQVKAAEEAADYKAAQLRSPSEITKRIKQAEEKMYQHARNLEFEEAASMRDEIQQLRAQLMKV